MYTTLLMVFTSGEENGILARRKKILDLLIPFPILLRSLTMGILFIAQVKQKNKNTF